MLEFFLQSHAVQPATELASEGKHEAGERPETKLFIISKQIKSY